MDLFYDYNLGKLSFDRNNLKEKMIYSMHTLRFLADNFNFYFF